MTDSDRNDGEMVPDGRMAGHYHRIIAMTSLVCISMADGNGDGDANANAVANAVANADADADGVEEWGW